MGLCGSSLSEAEKAGMHILFKICLLMKRIKKWWELSEVVKNSKCGEKNVGDNTYTFFHLFLIYSSHYTFGCILKMHSYIISEITFRNLKITIRSKIYKAYRHILLIQHPSSLTAILIYSHIHILKLTYKRCFMHLFSFILKINQCLKHYL